jgi:hypothetical protein
MERGRDGCFAGIRCKKPKMRKRGSQEIKDGKLKG